MLLSMAVTLQATATLVLAAPTAYVDFNAATNGTGGLGSPFNNIGDALSLVDNVGTVFFAPGTTSGAYRIGMAGTEPGYLYADKAMTLATTGAGTVALGAVTGYTLTTVVAGNGTVSPSAGQFAAGALVLTATPSGGWQFRRWELDFSGTVSPATLTMDADKTVLARFYLPGHADLVAREVGNPVGAAVRGDPVTVTWTVENYGDTTAPASGAWKDALYLSADNTWDEDDQQLGVKTIASPLAALTTREESLEVTVPDVAPGQYYFLVKIDIDDAIDEGNEPDEDSTAATQPLLVLDPVLNNE